MLKYFNYTSFCVKKNMVYVIGNHNNETPKINSYNKATSLKQNFIRQANISYKNLKYSSRKHLADCL